MSRATLGAQETRLGRLARVTRVSLSATAQARGEQGIDPEPAAQRLVGDFQSDAHQHHGAMRVRDDLFDQPVTAVRRGVREPVEQRPALGHLDPVLQVPFFLVYETFAIGEEELEVTRGG